LGLINRRRTIGTILVLIVASFCAISVYGVLLGDRVDDQVRQLVKSAYNAQRPGGGRLWEAPYAPLNSSPRLQPDVGRAQLLLLRQPDSEPRQRLQGLVYLAAADWQRFADISKYDSLNRERDAAALNNLGASYLGLSDKDPTFLLKALDAFEAAEKLAPRAPEPAFNLEITYRKLRFQHLADEMLRRYTGLDPNSRWHQELVDSGEVDEADVIERLRTLVESGNVIDAERLFEANVELCRRLVRDDSSSKETRFQHLLTFIADQMDRRYGDKTFKAMVEPLSGAKRDLSLAIREYVHEGAKLFDDGNYKESMQSYAEAGKLAAQSDSLFDHLWVDVNEVDTRIRLGEFKSARQSLATLAAVARQNGYIWLTARILSIYGSSIMLTDSYSEMLNLVSEADKTFMSIDAPSDRIRVLYYLAFYNYAAGDQDRALRVALEGLRLSNKTAWARLTTFHWIIGFALYQQNLGPRAVPFEKEAVEESEKVPNPGFAATMKTTLAQLYLSMAEDDLAEQALERAKVSQEKMSAGFDKVRTELYLNIPSARLLLAKKQYAEVERLLDRNLKLYPQQPFHASGLKSETLMLLGRTYEETGRKNLAAKTFNEAIELVENDDNYLQTEKLRVKFDDERRELYDSAIDFKYKEGSPDVAWTYLQKYRAKLFLEFLAQLNPNIEATRTKMERSRVQQLIPKDTQIIEYALLKDKLLIWLVTDKSFAVRSVEISRSELESKIETVLQKLRTTEDVDPQLTELGRLLIEPVGDLLDPQRTIVIIPDRGLNGLPFNALRRPGKNQYLIEQFPVVISPSLTYFLEAETRSPQRHRDAIIGFASKNGGAGELKELHALSSIYETVSLYSGQQVDRTAFLHSLNEAAVFHYAGHSVTDAADPLRSSILLDGNRYGPNSVTAVDISQQRLPKNAVVVLSSCDSSVGNSRDGIGVRGLTSAFLIGGAGAVVGSLWPVEETSTADLMIDFHRAFAHDGMPVAKALQKAQLKFLHSPGGPKRPYYWSGFVVTGNFSALR
jgi:CHAT domain-containing protein